MRIILSYKTFKKKIIWNEFTNSSMLLLITSRVSAIAQVTTSHMSGRVVDAEGPVIGVVMVAIHTPSGYYMVLLPPWMVGIILMQCVWVALIL